jgi:hypothetical protein
MAEKFAKMMKIRFFTPTPAEKPPGMNTMQQTWSGRRCGRR